MHDHLSRWRIALILILLNVLIKFTQASKRINSKKNWNPVLDTEIKSVKRNCFKDIDRMPAEHECRKSWASRENCGLQCTSPKCYHIIYGDDPLEEGEIDCGRSWKFRVCTRREIANGEL